MAERKVSEIVNSFVKRGELTSEYPELEAPISDFKEKIGRHIVKRYNSDTTFRERVDAFEIYLADPNKKDTLQKSLEEVLSTTDEFRSEENLAKKLKKDPVYRFKPGVLEPVTLGEARYKALARVVLALTGFTLPFLRNVEIDTEKKEKLAEEKRGLQQEISQVDNSSAERFKSDFQAEIRKLASQDLDSAFAFALVSNTSEVKRMFDPFKKRMLSNPNESEILTYLNKLNEVEAIDDLEILNTLGEYGKINSLDGRKNYLANLFSQKHPLAKRVGESMYDILRYSLIDRCHYYGLHKELE